MKIWRRLSWFLTFALLVAAFFSANTVQANPPLPEIGEAVETAQDSLSIQFGGCSPDYLPATNAAFEQQVAELVNQERAAVGLPPLKRIEALDQAARYHAKDMAADNYFGHDSFDRSGDQLFKVCDWFTRVGGFYSGWSWLGENIAAGYTTPTAVMKGWMESSGHRANILSTAAREFGVGYYGGGSWSHYWVQDFGNQRDSYPVIINGESASTDGPVVDLYLYGEGVWSEMRLKNDDQAWGNWQPFTKNVRWTLTWTQGVHTVSVELRKSGQIAAGASASDHIELVTSGSQLGNLPAQVTFIYNLETHELLPGAVTLQPLNILSELPIAWQVTGAPDWLSVSSSSGTTPTDTTVVQPKADVLDEVGNYAGTVVIAAEDESVLDSPKEIAVKLYVVASLHNRIYLPAVRR